MSPWCIGICTLDRRAAYVPLNRAESADISISYGNVK